jgi:hypothetical protein
MVISIGSELETVLNEQARQLGVSPAEVALTALQDRFLANRGDKSRDDWERRLRYLAVDCTVSLSDEAVSSEGIYE